MTYATATYLNSSFTYVFVHAYTSFTYVSVTFVLTFHVCKCYIRFHPSRICLLLTNSSCTYVAVKFVVILYVCYNYTQTNPLLILLLYIWIHHSRMFLFMRTHPSHLFLLHTNTSFTYVTITFVFTFHVCNCHSYSSFTYVTLSFVFILHVCYCYIRIYLSRMLLFPIARFNECSCAAFFFLTETTYNSLLFILLLYV